MGVIHFQIARLLPKSTKSCWCTDESTCLLCSYCFIHQRKQANHSTFESELYSCHPGCEWLLGWIRHSLGICCLCLSKNVIVLWLWVWSQYKSFIKMSYSVKITFYIKLRKHGGWNLADLVEVFVILECLDYILSSCFWKAGKMTSSWVLATYLGGLEWMSSSRLPHPAWRTPSHLRAFEEWISLSSCLVVSWIKKITFKTLYWKILLCGLCPVIFYVIHIHTRFSPGELIVKYLLDYHCSNPIFSQAF